MTVDAEPHARLTTEDELAGIRLDDLLERSFPSVQRAVWRRGCANETVTINRQRARPQQRVRLGDLVEVWFDPDAAPQLSTGGRAEPALPVLFEDAAVLVINKPSGLPTVPDRGGKNLGVWGRLSELRPDEDLRVAHRLDLGTSGCLILTKGLEAARALDLAFRNHEVAKTYLALACGEPTRAEFEVDRPLGPDRRRPGRVAVVARDSKGSREAFTRVAVAERFRGFALLEVFPRTGRSHQIRVHLAHRGHSIVGDPEYGDRRELLLSDVKRGYKARRGARERPLLRRPFLHAAAVEFTSPHDGARVRAECPLPAELELVLDKLRRFAPARRS